MHDDISTIQKGSPPRKDHLTDRDANIVAKAALLPVFGRKLHIGAVPAIWTISRSPEAKRGKTKGLARASRLHF